MDYFFDNLVKNVSTTKDALKKTIDVGPIIKEYVEEAQKEINDIYVKIEVITGGENKFNKSIIHVFNKVKAELRQSRQELITLAQETKILTQDVIDLLDHEEKLNIAEVELSINSLKELLERTRVLLNTAKTKYNTAINVMESVQTDLDLKLMELEKLSNAYSEKYKKWRKQLEQGVQPEEYGEELRSGVYSGCSAVTIGMILADIFGCFGICSATATSSCWAAAIASVESSIADYRNAVKVKDVENRANAVIASIGNLDETVKNAINGLNYELHILLKWEATARKVESKLGKKSFEPKILSAAKRIRKTLVRNVKELNYVAQEFLALPTSLFGDQ